MFHTIATPESITILWRGDSAIERGVASADDIGDRWWISRVLVQPATCRGRGVGSKLIEQLKAAVANQGGTRLVVAPGGYVGTAKERKRQKKFYEHHDFVEEEPGLFAWYPPPT